MRAGLEAVALAAIARLALPSLPPALKPACARAARLPQHAARALKWAVHPLHARRQAGHGRDAVVPECTPVSEERSEGTWGPARGRGNRSVPLTDISVGGPRRQSRRSRLLERLHVGHRLLDAKRARALRSGRQVRRGRARQSLARTGALLTLL